MNEKKKVARFRTVIHSLGFADNPERIVGEILALALPKFAVVVCEGKKFDYLINAGTAEAVTGRQLSNAIQREILPYMDDVYYPHGTDKENRKVNKVHMALMDIANSIEDNDTLLIPKTMSKSFDQSGADIEQRFADDRRLQELSEAADRHSERRWFYA